MNGLFRPSADLFEQLSRLQNQFDQAFFRPGASIRALAGAAFPALNVGSTAETVEVMALAPGLDPTAIQLTIEYDPHPPLDCGDADRAPAALRDNILARVRAREDELAAGAGHH